MEIYFFGGTDQRVYTTNDNKSVPAYSYSGAFQIFGNIFRDGDKISPPLEKFRENVHDKRLNLRFYNASLYAEKDIEIVSENDSKKRHHVYRLDERELLQLPKSQEYEQGYEISDEKNDDKKIVVLWPPKNQIFSGLPETANCYIWIAEDSFPKPDWFRSFKGNKIIVTKSETLRSYGANISRSLSWEKTANETVWQVTQNRFLRDHLLYAQVVLITFGLEGIIIIDNTKPRPGGWENTLWFSPSYMEDDVQTNHPGFVPEAFEALIYKLVDNVRLGLYNEKPLLESICFKLKEHLEAAIQVHMCGYRLIEYRLFLNYDYTIDSLENNNFQIETPRYRFCSVHIPDHDGEWSIAFDAANKELGQVGISDVLFKIIKKGVENVVKCPMLKIGNLVTIDRSEIESYSNIRNLLRDYISSKKPGKPLSIAVFGQPGSGKSFGVKEIAKNLIGDQAKFLEYNLSQYGEANISALLTAFHDIQDETLQGNIPLVFFDEFDSNGLEWLKYFLMPMEDGRFIENGTQHPLGRCILVFAGGTHHTFEQLAQKCEGEEKRREDYAAKKLTDFLSRLKGYINILGINQSDQSNRLEQNILFRRAVILSNMTKQLEVKLSRDVLYALLYTKEYKHGVRSMKAIIEMSRHVKSDQLEMSDLPPCEQLKLHVDPQDFRKRVEDRILWEERNGRIARCLLWNEENMYWEDCSLEKQYTYWEKAERIIEIIYRAFDLQICLCGDTNKVSEVDRSVFIDGSKTDDSKILNRYAKKLHKYLYKYKRGESQEWHDCVDIEWNALGAESLNWLTETTRQAFAPFRQIKMDDTSYYLAGELNDDGTE
jgi:hypothetical protein